MAKKTMRNRKGVAEPHAHGFSMTYVCSPNSYADDITSLRTRPTHGAVAIVN